MLYAPILIRVTRPLAACGAAACLGLSACSSSNQNSNWTPPASASDKTPAVIFTQTAGSVEVRNGGYGSAVARVPVSWTSCT